MKTPDETLHSSLMQGKAALEAALQLDSGTARIETQLLLQHALGVSRAWLLAHPEHVLDKAEQSAFNSMLQRRLRGEPIAYIFGEREFYGLNFKVTPATLIPRADTELLVELALERIPQPLPASPCASIRHADCLPAPLQGRSAPALRVLDLGTGSGAIGLSIAHARPDVEVTAVDASPAALDVARQNAQRLNLGNVRLLRSDWFSALADEHFHLIVSNPPYIADSDAHLAQGDLRFEPRTALASGTDGLSDIRRIVTQAKHHLNTGGWLLLEHGYDQAARVCELLRQAKFSEVFSAHDLAGIERVSGGLA